MTRASLGEAKSFFAAMFKEFMADKCFHLSAALSYYTLFSLAPFLILVIAVAGLFFGREAVTGEIFQQLRGLIGAEGAAAIQEMIEKAGAPKAGRWAAALGAGTLLLGATTVFIQLQDALNMIWSVKAKPKRGIFKMVRDRLLSFGMILGVGFLLLVSLAAHGLITILSRWLEHALPYFPVAVVRAIEIAVSFGMTGLLFAMLFKFLPDAKVRWRDTWIGAFATAGLFSAGKVMIGLYLGQSNLASTYGAAAAIVLVILWVNYSSLILFFGAEFTQVWACRYGTEIVPRDYAVRVKKLEEVVEAGPDAELTPPPPSPPPRRTGFRDPELDRKIVRSAMELAALSALSRVLLRWKERRERKRGGRSAA